MALTDRDLLGATAARFAGDCGKERFANAKDAERVQRRCRYGRKVEPYRCPRCRGWHLGGAKSRRPRPPIGDLA